MLQRGGSALPESRPGSETRILPSHSGGHRTMRLDTSQHMRQEMRLRMAPRMIQSMEILQLPLMALQERIDQELIENPMLVDLRESTTPEPEPEAETPATPAEDPTPTEAGDMDDWDSYGEGHRLSRAAL